MVMIFIMLNVFIYEGVFLYGMLYLNGIFFVGYFWDDIEYFSGLYYIFINMLGDDEFIIVVYINMVDSIYLVIFIGSMSFYIGGCIFDESCILN